MKRFFAILASLAIAIGLTACSPSYSTKDAEKHGYVLFKDGVLTNEELLDTFISGVSEGKEGSVRVVVISAVSGKPTIYDLSYDGKTISYSIDRTNDPYTDKSYVQSTATSVSAGVKERPLGGNVRYYALIDAVSGDTITFIEYIIENG